MTIEMLDKPVLQVKDGDTYHILAIQRVASEEPDMPDKHEPIGYVALIPSLMERFVDDATTPFMIHDTMKVQGIIGGKEVYDKTVSPKGFLGFSKPLYGMRIAIARHRAAHRVTSLLS